MLKDAGLLHPTEETIPENLPQRLIPETTNNLLNINDPYSKANNVQCEHVCAPYV